MAYNLNTIYISLHGQPSDICSVFSPINSAVNFCFWGKNFHHVVYCFHHSVYCFHLCLVLQFVWQQYGIVGFVQFVSISVGFSSWYAVTIYSVKVMANSLTTWSVQTFLTMSRLAAGFIVIEDSTNLQNEDFSTHVYEITPAHLGQHIWDCSCKKKSWGDR